MWALAPRRATRVHQRLWPLVGAAVLCLAACATNHPLMPIPALYVGAHARPLFGDVPADSPAPPLELLYITDRAPSGDGGDTVRYGAERSRSTAFGLTTVLFGANVPTNGPVPPVVDLDLGPTRELGRFPRIPYDVGVTATSVIRAPEVLKAHDAARAALQAMVERQLAQARRKEVVLYVHGYHNTFADAALTMGELCHFLGREFVCGIFSWPAGGKRGILFGYNVDRESAEFAVEDLLKAIRIIAATPGVERVHLLAHSRGTDVLATALSELSVEAYIQRKALSEVFRIGNVLLMAPDVDADVETSKIYKVFSDPDLPFGAAPAPQVALKHSGLKVTVYVSPDDKALAASSWLSGSLLRLGRLDPTRISPHQIEQVRLSGLFDVIEVTGTTDFFGHGYFVSNPYVSADIVALLRYGLKPNEPGRPLDEVARPFWRIPSERAQ